MKEIDANKLMHLTAKVIGFAEAMVFVLECDGHELGDNNLKMLNDHIKEFNEITGSELRSYNELVGDIKKGIRTEAN